MSVTEKARLYRELGKLLASGFHMDRTVTLLLGQGPSPGRRAFLQAVQHGLDERLSFAEALRKHHGGLASGLELSLLDSGERSGRLGEACTHLARYFAVWDAGARAARSAMVYPLLLLHAGVVLPQFSRATLLGAMGKEVNATNAIVWRLVLFWAALLVLWLVWKSLSAAAQRSRWVDEWIGYLPLIGSVRRHWALARFCQVFHSGLLASMRITDCLHLSGDASQSGLLRAGASSASKRVAEGEELAPSLGRTHCFPKIFTDSISTAEAAGGLDTEMARWAEAETEMAAEAQARVAEYYPKALYFCILGYVGYSIVSFATEYFGVLSSGLDGF